MKVSVRLSTTLRRHAPHYDPEKGLEAELESGARLSALGLAERMGLPSGEIKFVMLNGRHQPLEAILQDGDRVAYFPAVGGG